MLEAKLELLQCNYIVQTCYLLEGLIPSKEENYSLKPQHLEHIYIFSVMWNIGALLELDSRAKMESWMRENKPELDYPPCDPEKEFSL
uniref:Dynein heavy chain AAA 5 extension domain-containing protein n=1 Tax=Amphimedon queenslandica TaxID=400682 RepID=A0A1X7TC80_AMPQE